MHPHINPPSSYAQCACDTCRATIGQLPPQLNDVEQWFQVWVALPVVGQNWFGWLWTGELRAGLLVGHLSQRGDPVTITYADGRPVAALTIPGMSF